MKNILVICPSPENESPGQRLKYEQYFNFFRRNGYTITVSSFFNLSAYKILYTKGNFFKKVFWVLWGYLKRVVEVFRLSHYDGIYIFLHVTPFGSTFFERLFRIFGKKVIYDIDDLVFLCRASKFNSWTAFLRKPDKYFYLMKSSDHIITCTPYLDELVKKHNSKTTDISSTINTDLYIPIENYSNDRKLVIGWSGSHSNLSYIRIIEPVLRDLQKQFEFKFLVIGAKSFKMENIDVEAIPWRESTEVNDLRRIDIGIYPLPDEQWVYGKSGLKALQYMALGIPTVATAIGANFRIIEDQVSGFLVNSDEEWRIRLEELLRSPELRKQIGLKARERVEKYYSVRANEPTYLKIFKNVYG
jgi:glycosyltransferase involved in cell wall biosynthesis